MAVAIFRTEDGLAFPMKSLPITIECLIKSVGKGSEIEVRHELEDERQLPVLLRYLANRIEFHRIP